MPAGGGGGGGISDTRAAALLTRMRSRSDETDGLSGPLTTGLPGGLPAFPAWRDSGWACASDLRIPPLSSDRCSDSYLCALDFERQ